MFPSFGYRLPYSYKYILLVVILSQEAVTWIKGIGRLNQVQVTNWLTGITI